VSAFLQTASGALRTVLFNFQKPGAEMSAQPTPFLTTELRKAGRAARPFGQEVTTTLICDDPVVGAGLMSVLAGTCFVASEIALGKGTSPRLLADWTCTLVIIDADQNADRMTEMVSQAKEHFPNARVFVLADHLDPDFVMQGRDAGADGFCLTTSSREVLIKSLELVMLGLAVLPSVVLRAIFQGTTGVAVRKLTHREAQILRCLTTGDSNKAIARKFDLAEATVKIHVKAILRKIGAANRTQAAVWANEHLPRRAAGLVNGSGIDHQNRCQ
jgi:two-component system, NarL family, nitrate/nitrite response regulator NarL